MAGKAIANTGKFFGNLVGSVGGHPCRIEVVFSGGDGQAVPTVRAHPSAKLVHSEDEVPLYSHAQSVCGQVRITPLQSGKLEHQGVRAQLVGIIELTSDRGHGHEFLSLSRELAPAGEIRVPETFEFDFRNVEMRYDSYRGHAVRLRYFVRITLTKSLASVVKEFTFCVQNPQDTPVTAEPIKLEVGIDECLHLEFEYNSNVYGLRDCVHGKIFFWMVRINLKKMELEVRRRETTGAGANVNHNTVTLNKYEIMDGAPVKGETVPVRLYLAPFDLTPSYDNVHNKFSVKYYINLVLVDMEDRRYFKQQEITVIRRPEQAHLEPEQ